MSAGIVGGAGSSVTNAVGGGGSGFANLTSGEFIKVLLSELTNQDPFKPQDSGALLEQFSSLRNIESQIQLQEKLQALVLQNGISSAAVFIGKEVEGLDSGNDSVSGVVTSVRVESGKAVLELSSGKTLSVDRVTRVMDLKG